MPGHGTVGVGRCAIRLAYARSANRNQRRQCLNGWGESRNHHSMAKTMDIAQLEMITNDIL